MNVRKLAATTFSLFVLIVGLNILLPLLLHTLPYEVMRYIDARFFSQHSIGGYHKFMVYTTMWLIIVAGIVDAILKKRVALSLLSSFNIPIVLGIPVIIFAIIPALNNYIFWGVFYIAVIVGVYWSFRKFIENNQAGSQKLIPFIKSISSGIGTGDSHLYDRIVVWEISLLQIVFFASSLISLIIYAATYWSML